MPARISRLSRLLNIRRAPARRAFLPALLAVAAAAMIGAAPVGAATSSSVDMYFGSGYERQIDNRTCTAASVAMMMNFIARRDLNLSQMAILRYEQPRDALNDSVLVQFFRETIIPTAGFLARPFVPREIADLLDP